MQKGTTISAGGTNVVEQGLETLYANNNDVILAAGMPVRLICVGIQGTVYASPFARNLPVPIGTHQGTPVERSPGKYSSSSSAGNAHKVSSAMCELGALGARYRMVPLHVGISSGSKRRGVS